MIIPYLKYRLKASSKHGVHSPFVFDFVTKVLEDKTEYAQYGAIERIRTKLLSDQRVIHVTDHGTGSSGPRKVSEIVARAGKNEKYGRLLFRIQKYFQPAKSLELGTSAGISAAYLASAFHGELITIEGCPETAKIAKENFSGLGLHHVKQLTGEIGETLPGLICKEKEFNLVFFDANHTRKATQEYFRICLSAAGNNSVFIFDDIHWSNEMTKAWDDIRNHSSVTVSIDLFSMGLVFFRKEQAKEHFVLRY